MEVEENEEDKKEAIQSSSPDSQIFVNEEEVESGFALEEPSPHDTEEFVVEIVEKPEEVDDLSQREDASQMENASHNLFSPTEDERPNIFAAALDQQQNIFSPTADGQQTFTSSIEKAQQQTIFSPTAEQDLLISSPTEERYTVISPSASNEDNDNDDFSPVDGERQGAISAFDDRCDQLVSPTNEERSFTSPTEERQQNVVSPTEEERDVHSPTEERKQDVVSPTKERQLAFSPTEERQDMATPTEDLSEQQQQQPAEQDIDQFTIQLANESHSEELVHSNGYNNINNDIDIRDDEGGNVMSFQVKQAWNDDEKKGENEDEKMTIVDATYTTDACSPDGKFTVGQYSSTFGDNDNDESSDEESDEQESPNHYVVMSSVKPTIVGDLQQNGEDGFDVNSDQIVGDNDESNVYF